MVYAWLELAKYPRYAICSGSCISPILFYQVQHLVWGLNGLDDVIVSSQCLLAIFEGIVPALASAELSALIDKHT
jgi:hypothetical protein